MQRRHDPGSQILLQSGPKAIVITEGEGELLAPRGNSWSWFLNAKRFQNVALIQGR